jgi:hypothetical protein
MRGASSPAVMAGLVPAIHAYGPRLYAKAPPHLTAWMAGTSPAMTSAGRADRRSLLPLIRNPHSERNHQCPT